MFSLLISPDICREQFRRKKLFIFKFRYFMQNTDILTVKKR